jgi:hypothetical protein
MKLLKYTALLSTLALVFSLNCFARSNNERSVTISDPVQVGSTQLKPGTYKVEWQGTGPAVQVSFLQGNKTLATVPGMLKTNDDQVTRDAIVTDTTSSHGSTLKEIDFHRQKEAVVFDQSGM